MLVTVSTCTLSVRLVVEEITQRMPDRGRLEQRGCDLVEQRLERVVVVLVDHHDVDVRLLQRPGGADAGEAASEDQDARAPTVAFIRHVAPPS